MTKDNALKLAEQYTQQTKRKHVVRDDRGFFFVCPLYEPGREGSVHDAGYTALGLLVKESL